MKTERLKLENKIFDVIYKDNHNTPHFDYHVMFEEGKIRLDLYTYNQRIDDFLLLHSVINETPILCLRDIIEYLENHNYIKKERKPVSIIWNKKGSDVKHESYYFDEPEEAKRKFLYGKIEEDYNIEIKINPMS